jgi:hypothetical protein
MLILRSDGDDIARHNVARCSVAWREPIETPVDYASSLARVSSVQLSIGSTCKIQRARVASLKPAHTTWQWRCNCPYHLPGKLAHGSWDVTFHDMKGM